MNVTADPQSSGHPYHEHPTTLPGRWQPRRIISLPSASFFETERSSHHLGQPQGLADGEQVRESSVLNLTLQNLTSRPGCSLGAISLADAMQQRRSRGYSSEYREAESLRLSTCDRLPLCTDTQAHYLERLEWS